MKLLLTSAGFLNREVTDTFLKLINKPTGQIHIIFVPTASRTEEEMRYVESARQELIDLGIRDIITLNLDHPLADDEISGADAVYVCGGNTFYLLQKIRESGFDRLLKIFNGVYVGVSAGSVVVGPNIEVSGPWDENDVRVSDTTGMGMVNFAVVPHYQRKEQPIVADLKKRADYEIMELTDNQAVLVENGERKIIGQP